jgi:hypothetical protein
MPMSGTFITAHPHARRRLFPHTATATQWRLNSGGARLCSEPGVVEDAACRDAAVLTSCRYSRMHSVRASDTSTAAGIGHCINSYGTYGWQAYGHIEVP